MGKGYSFVDIKTTGKDPVLDRIIYIAVSLFGENMKLKKSYSTYVNPETTVPARILKKIEVSQKGLERAPIFFDISETIWDLINGTKICFYSPGLRVAEFLKEELFSAGFRLKLEKNSVIDMCKLEDKISGRSLKDKYYKYTGQVMDYHLPTMAAAEVFKGQCRLMRVDPSDYNEVARIDFPFEELQDKYLHFDGKTYLMNFGKHYEKPLEEVPEDYIQWVLYEDFPHSMKQKILDYLGHEKFDLINCEEYLPNPENPKLLARNLQE